jgi:hypothetical protein
MEIFLRLGCDDSIERAEAIKGDERDRAEGDDVFHQRCAAMIERSPRGDDSVRS